MYSSRAFRGKKMIRLSSDHRWELSLKINRAQIRGLPPRSAPPYLVDIIRVFRHGARSREPPNFSRRKRYNSRNSALVRARLCTIAMRMRHIAFQAVAAAFRKPLCALRSPTSCVRRISSLRGSRPTVLYLPVRGASGHGFRTCLGLGQHVTCLRITRI